MKQYAIRLAAIALVSVLAAPHAAAAWKLGELDGCVALWSDDVLVQKSTVALRFLPEIDRKTLQNGLLLPTRADASRAMEDFSS